MSEKLHDLFGLTPLKIVEVLDTSENNNYVSTQESMVGDVLIENLFFHLAKESWPNVRTE